MTPSAKAEMAPSCSTAFWDALAPFHATIEDHYLDRRSIRYVMALLQEPVLVIGAGQGLIVEEIQKHGLRCDGVDFSPEMIRYARIRRGLSLVQADAKALPFSDGSYRSVVFATGVVDFTADDDQVTTMLNEGKRVVQPGGKILVGFYRLSPPMEAFVRRVGLIESNMALQRKSLELYLLSPSQMVSWIARQAGVSFFHALGLMLVMSARSTLQEKRMTFRMQSIFRKMSDPHALIRSAPEKQVYRNEAEIRNLFERLQIPIKKFEVLASCSIVTIQ